MDSKIWKKVKSENQSLKRIQKSKSVAIFHTLNDELYDVEESGEAMAEVLESAIRQGMEQGLTEWYILGFGSFQCIVYNKIKLFRKQFPDVRIYQATYLSESINMRSLPYFMDSATKDISQILCFETKSELLAFVSQCMGNIIVCSQSPDDLKAYQRAGTKNITNLYPAYWDTYKKLRRREKKWQKKLPSPWESMPILTEEELRHFCSQMVLDRDINTVIFVQSKIGSELQRNNLLNAVQEIWKQEIEKAVASGTQRFIIANANLFTLMAAKEIVRQQEIGKEIKLAFAFTSPTPFGLKSNPYITEQFQKIFAKAEIIFSMRKTNKPFCDYKRFWDFRSSGYLTIEYPEDDDRITESIGWKPVKNLYSQIYSEKREKSGNYKIFPLLHAHNTNMDLLRADNVLSKTKEVNTAIYGNLEDSVLLSSNASLTAMEGILKEHLTYLAEKGNKGFIVGKVGTFQILVIKQLIKLQSLFPEIKIYLVTDHERFQFPSEEMATNYYEVEPAIEHAYCLRAKTYKGYLEQYLNECSSTQLVCNAPFMASPAICYPETGTDIFPEYLDKYLNSENPVQTPLPRDVRMEEPLPVYKKHAELMRFCERMLLEYSINAMIYFYGGRAKYLKEYENTVRGLLKREIEKAVRAGVRRFILTDMSWPSILAGEIISQLSMETEEELRIAVVSQGAVLEQPYSGWETRGQDLLNHAEYAFSMQNTPVSTNKYMHYWKYRARYVLKLAYREKQYWLDTIDHGDW